MTKLPKIFLIISLTAFLGAFTEAGSDIAWGILKPLSAISFILFFLTNLLAGEMAKFDQEEQLRAALADQNSITPEDKSSKDSSEERPKTPALVTAASRS